MIKILNVEVKTTATGKPYKSFEANDGEKAVKASCWSDSAIYGAITHGAEVEGTLVQNAKGYWNIAGKLEPPKFMQARGNYPNKTEAIKEAQENKQDAIKMSSTFRDATTLTALYPDMHPKIFDASTPVVTTEMVWMYWRKWLWDNYDNTTGKEKVEKGAYVPPMHDYPINDMDAPPF